MRLESYNKIIELYKKTTFTGLIIIFGLGVFNKLVLHNSLVDFFLYGAAIGYIIGAFVSFLFLKKKILSKEE